MDKTTGIQWCDATWNPWQGCTPVASGCAHCYMFREKRAFGQDPTRVVRSKEGTFNAPLSWRDPRRIFVCSWSDFFHPAADEWREGAWRIMAMRPRHTYIIPTKRIERVADHLPWMKEHRPPWPNVWIGVSASTDPEFEAMVPVLLDSRLDVALRFVSLEPLLGPINIEWALQEIDLGDEEHSAWTHALDWVIVAGESGGPMNRALCAPLERCGPYRPIAGRSDWVRSIRDQCREYDVPFFFKGWGGPRPTSGGRMLDGREWAESPTGDDGRGKRDEDRER